MHPDHTDTVDVADQVAAFKRSLAPRRAELQLAFVEAKDHIARAVDAILADAAAGRPVVPEVDYRHINDGLVSDATRAAIRKTGCVVVRGVFPESVGEAWFAELGEYLDATATSSARSTSAASTSTSPR